MLVPVSVTGAGGLPPRNERVAPTSGLAVVPAVMVPVRCAILRTVNPAMFSAETTGEVLAQKLHVLTTTYERAEKGLQGLGDTLDRRAKEIGNISELALTKVSAWDRTPWTETRP